MMESEAELESEGIEVDSSTAAPTPQNGEDTNAGISMGEPIAEDVTTPIEPADVPRDLQSASRPEDQSEQSGSGVIGHYVTAG